jgi:hypothetical protein
VSQYDAPDWQTIITISTGPVSDSPDWQTTVTGPSGGAVPGAGGGDWEATDYGLVGWSAPINSSNWGSTFAEGGGQLFTVPVKILTTTSITHIAMGILGSGKSFVANENYMAIYTCPYTSGSPTTFTLAAATAAGAAEAVWTLANGVQFVALSSSLAVTAGEIVWAAIMFTITGSGTAQLVGLTGTATAFPTNSTTWKAITGPSWGGPYTTPPGSLTFATANQQSGIRPYAFVY